MQRDAVESGASNQLPVTPREADRSPTSGVRVDAVLVTPTPQDEAKDTHMDSSKVIKAVPATASANKPVRTLPWRLGCMAEAMVSAKVGPQARFFTRECVDEVVLLLREAERFILEGR